MNNVPDIKQIDASRKVCLDCENMMTQQGVSINTPPSGKRSRKRLNLGIDCDDE